MGSRLPMESIAKPFHRGSLRRKPNSPRMRTKSNRALAESPILSGKTNTYPELNWRKTGTAVDTLFVFSGALIMPIRH